MKTITVKGDKNTGKTTLLKYAYKYFLADGADIIEYDCNDFLTDDFYCYLIWRGIKIIIFSMGDSLKYIKQGIAKAKYWKVNVLLNSLTNSVSQTNYSKLLPEEEKSISVISKTDKEDRVQQKQRVFFKEILPELKKMI